MTVSLSLQQRIRGLEQHGHAAGGATKAPVGLLLVRGSQPVGMSTGRTAAEIENESIASPEKRPRPYHKKARQTTVRVP